MNHRAAQTNAVLVVQASSSAWTECIMFYYLLYSFFYYIIYFILYYIILIDLIATPTVQITSYGPAPVTWTWTVYTIPLSALGATDGYCYFALFNLFCLFYYLYCCYCYVFIFI